MIRPRDAIILAFTKLRTHKVRTGVTVGVAGILFGALFSGVIISQGVFESVERYGKEGLSDRSILTITKFGAAYFDPYEHRDDVAFVAEVKQAHADRVAKKTAAAKKYTVDYDARAEDPSPIEINKGSGKEQISEHALMGNEIVDAVIAKRSADLRKPLDIAAFLEPYQSAKVLGDTSLVQPSNGTLNPMQGGKEKIDADTQERLQQFTGGDEQPPSIQVLHETVTAPFVIKSAPKVADNELPGIVSFSYGEKLLGLKPLTKESTNEQKLARLQEVRQRIGEVTASFCYRNTASLNLLAQAVAQRDEIERSKADKEYKEPALLYALPSEESCGAVTIAKDTRSAEQKRFDDAFIAYQKEIGEYVGDAQQHKITLRAIGLSGDSPGNEMSGSAEALVMSLLGSWLYYGPVWTISADTLASAPEALRPAALFGGAADEENSFTEAFFRQDTYMVEFEDKNEAREVLRKSGTFSDDIYASAFGSGTLVVDQAKQWLATGLLWALMTVGGVALIILASLIGRMVSDGRRESAVFRAIGAKRSDIGSIYGMYALLLSLRVAVFALVLGMVIAAAVELWLSADATLGARLAYAAAETTQGFHFIGINSWYIAIIFAAIIATGLVASILPILLGARRNPITDMRDD